MFAFMASVNLGGDVLPTSFLCLRGARGMRLLRIEVGIKFCDVNGEVLVVGDCPSIDL
jgi:hypothetical protein